MFAQEDETRGVHVGQLVAAQMLELTDHGFVMRRFEAEQFQKREICQSQPERAGRLLA